MSSDKKRYGFNGEVLPEGIYTVPGSRYYYYCFKLKGHPYVRKCSKTANLEGAIAILLAEINKMRMVDYNFARKEVKLFAAMDEYVEEHPNQIAHKISFAVWKEYLKSDLWIHEISARVISKFRAWRREHSNNKGLFNISDSTVNRDMSALRRLLNWSNAYYGLKINPQDMPFNNKEVVKFTSEEPNQIERYLSMDEIQRLFTAPSMKGKVRQLCYFAMNCYMRQGQILSRKWTDIDWQLCRIVIGQSKFKKKPTFVDLNEGVVEMLKSMPRDSEYIFGYEGWDEKHRRTPKAKLWWHYKTAFFSALRQAKIENFTFHLFRHTAATYTAAKTGDLNALQKLLNHSSINMTMRYAHIIDSARKHAAEELGKVYKDVISLNTLCQTNVKVANAENAKDANAPESKPELKVV